MSDVISALKSVNTTTVTATAANMWRPFLRTGSDLCRRTTSIVSRRTMAEMPVPQSSKAVLFQGHAAREGWEWTMAWWYGVSGILLVGILGTTPATDIENWASEEARARLLLREQQPDFEFEFGKHYADKVTEQKHERWDKFSHKSLRFLDDDDDDDDDDDEEEDDDE